MSGVMSPLLNFLYRTIFFMVSFSFKVPFTFSVFLFQLDAFLPEEVKLVSEI